MLRRLVQVADRLNHEQDPLKRAKLLLQLGEVSQEALRDAIVDANTAGDSWRAIGADLGIPHQTLYKRFGQRRTQGGN